jgi:hypothetical protein
VRAGGRGHDTNNDSGEWGEDEEAQAVPVDLPPHGLVIVIDGVEEVGGHTREDERDTTGCMRNQVSGTGFEDYHQVQAYRGNEVRRLVN